MNLKKHFIWLFVVVLLPASLLSCARSTDPSVPFTKKRQLTVDTIQRDTVRVASPKIFTICMYEVYCCHEETLKAIPLEGDKGVLLSELKSISFTTPEAIALTFLDGKVSQATIRQSTACPDANWRLRGKAALGDYEIELGSLKSIER